MAQLKQQNSNTLGMILLVLVAIALSVYAYMKLDYRIEKIDQGYQGEARTNPYLAAEYFLLRMGQSAEKINLFEQSGKWPSVDDTLLISSDRLGFDRRHSQQLMGWVKQGGHLIITARALNKNDPPIRDYILDDIGLHIARTDIEDEEADFDPPVNVAVGDDFLLVDFDDYRQIIVDSRFNQSVRWKIEDNGRLHGLQMLMGEGLLTVLSDLDMFRSFQINSQDNAAFLFMLASEQLSRSEQNVFYYSLYEDHIGLVSWLHQNAWPMMLSLYALIIVVLWNIVPRFGPLVHVQQPVRRRFTDHLAAAGNYLWRQGHYTYLLKAVRGRIIQQIQQQYPEWRNLTREKQLQQLSELSDINEKKIEKALFEQDVRRVGHFIHFIRTLETLRKRL